MDNFGLGQHVFTKMFFFFVDGCPFIATGKLSQLFVKSMVSKPLAEPKAQILQDIRSLASQLSQILSGLVSEGIRFHKFCYLAKITCSYIYQHGRDFRLFWICSVAIRSFKI
jgi:hypothetical protein